jgi:5'(3')-deoxyribonucleotidase
MAIKTIYLDMDGVLCDFATPSLVAQGFSEADSIQFLGNWNAGMDLAAIRSPEKYATSEGMKAYCDDIFWNNIKKLGINFWHSLRPYPWFNSLIAQVEHLGYEWFILSSPGNHADAAAGKIDWLHAQFGNAFDRFILTHYKETLANEGTLLIDDSEKQCERFYAAGGRVILFPAPWNHYGKFATDVVTVTLKGIHAVEKGE